MESYEYSSPFLVDWETMATDLFHLAYIEKDHEISEMCLRYATQALMIARLDRVFDLSE